MKKLFRALAIAGPQPLSLGATAIAQQPPLRIGFVYVGPIGDAGWTSRTTTAARRWRRSSAARSRPATSRTCPKAPTPSA